MRVFMGIVGVIWALLGGGCAIAGLTFGSGLGFIIGLLPLAGGVGLLMLSIKNKEDAPARAKWAARGLLTIGCLGLFTLVFALWKAGI